MSRRPEPKRENGQILVLFALMLTVLVLIAALLYSGAQSLVLRRQLQNAGDAAALSAANLMLNGTAVCSSTRIATSGAGNDLYTAAKNSVITNLGWTAAQITAHMTVSCPSGLDIGVTVALNGTGPRYFGSGSLGVATSSTAVNGQHVTGDYSVAMLDPSNPTWTGHGGRTGCASYLVNGGVTVTYEGSIFVDSTCTLADSSNGAVKAANSAFSMTMINGAKLYIGGQASAGTDSKITPTPQENVRPLLADPLSGLIKPCHATDITNAIPNCVATTLPAKDTGTSGQGMCKTQKVACVLSPGTYSGGLLAANGAGVATLLLRPGVYYIQGGGLQLKSGAGQIISIPAASGTCGGVGLCTSANAVSRYCGSTNNTNQACNLTTTQVATNWQADCPSPPTATTCGVLIYNAKADANSGWTLTGGTADTVDNGSQGALLLRAYQPANDPTNGTIFASYKNVVLWQARTPAPTASAAQPKISMVGGACVVLSGTVYAPGAEVDFGGSSCGSGGGADAQMTLQFVVWDLTLAGNNNFYFAYRRSAFATPFAYGIIR